MLLHIERKLLLRRSLATILPLKSNFVSMLLMEVSKCWKIVQFNSTNSTIVQFQLKWKNLKHLTSSKQRSVWRKLFSSPTDNSFLRLLNKTFRTEIYRNIQTLAVQVLRESFFWHQPETFFWLCCGSIFFIMLSELRFVKWVRFFERNCIVKWEIFFASFCWPWDFVGFESFQKIWN